MDMCNTIKMGMKTINRNEIHRLSWNFLNNENLEKYLVGAYETELNGLIKSISMLIEIPETIEDVLIAVPLNAVVSIREEDGMGLRDFLREALKECMVRFECANNARKVREMFPELFNRKVGV